MGGSITMIIRESEKKVHKMVRWTNSFPYFIKHSKFITKDKAHLDEYLRYWNEMSDDYSKNKATGKFEFPMTDVYVPNSGHVAPTEYGIIFIDYVNNKIISCQGYSSIDRLNMSAVTLAYDHGKRDPDWKENFDAMQDLYNNGYLSKLKNHKGYGAALSKNFNESKSSFLEKIKIMDKERESMMCYFNVKYGPFEVIENRDDKKGMLKTYKEIKELISLTKEEEKRWKKYFKQRYE